MTDNEVVFRQYKPLRNSLRQCYLSESLYVLWAYNQLLQFNSPLPPNIQVPLQFSTRDSLQYGLLTPWELEVLIRESVINCNERVGSETLRRWNYFANTLNKLKALENYIGGIYVNEKNVLLELTRIAHRQFPWQEMYPQSKVLIRYFLLYSNSELTKIIQNKIGISVKKLFFIGSALLGAYLKNPAHIYPFKVEISGLSVREFELFFNHFSINLADLKKKLVEEQEFNEKYSYTFNTMRAFPLIKMDYHDQASIVCPSVTLFFWRFTSGIYYEICKEKNFDKAFGLSFQSYVGKILERALFKLPFYPESQYFVGKDRKDSVDWIVDGDSLLFIECKTRRMAYSGKLELTKDESINTELKKMSEIILQVYKTINDYRNGYYKHFKLNVTKKIFPLIVTLEEWYVFGDKLVIDLRKLVEQQFKEKKLPLEWLDEMPYSLCSVDEFEEIMQVMEQTNVKKFIEGKVNDKDKKMYVYHTYAFNSFPEEAKMIKNLFDDEWDELFVNFKEDVRP